MFGLKTLPQPISQASATKLEIQTQNICPYFIHSLLYKKTIAIEEKTPKTLIVSHSHPLFSIVSAEH